MGPIFKETEIITFSLKEFVLFNCGGAEDSLDDVCKSESTNNNLLLSSFLVLLNVCCGESLSRGHASVYIRLSEVERLLSPTINVLVLPLSRRDTELFLHSDTLLAKRRPVAR